MTEQHDSIRISIKTRYLPEQSQPQLSKFVFTYTITIHNDGDETVQLISRRWNITDANGRVQEVAGIGVVGEQPILAAGEEYTYTSGAVLDTETGTMKGFYQMRTDSGELFDAAIPVFALIPPHRLH